MLVLAFTGFRVVTLMRKCLELGSDGHPYLRYFNVKAKREAMLPIPPLLAEQLNRQEAFLAERYPDTEWLLPSRLRRGAKRGAFHIHPSSVANTIERYVRGAEIRAAEGKLALDVHPHLFRHNVGTTMVNENIPLTVIQDVLDHGSVEMTARYARMRDETIRQAVRRWHERVNIRGERIALPTDGPLEQAAWMKERIARAKQALPNGSAACRWCSHARTRTRVWGARASSPMTHSAPCTSSSRRRRAGYWRRRASRAACG